MTTVNKYFDKVFIISLFDKVERWKKVKKRFDKLKIKAQRFIAVDGRCGDKQSCLDKLKTFEMIYDVKIKVNKENLKKMIPASSLTLGTILLLRAMVKNRWKRILICEDDIYFSRNFLDKFKEGIKEIENKKYDLLYLGCGHECGVNGISESKDSKNKHETAFGLYATNKDDLRDYSTKCKNVSDHISLAHAPGGTWCYAVSLNGAKKILKLLDNAGQHIDQFYIKNVKKKKLKALSFDPPIVYHEEGFLRPDSDIPW